MEDRQGSAGVPVEALRRRIRERSAVIGVIGLGYVGLPLAVAFARAGFRVIGIDTDGERVACINRGQGNVLDLEEGELLDVLQRGRADRPDAGSGGLEACSDFDRLGEVDAVSICVPTPLRKTKDPDISAIIEATRQIGCRLRAGMLIVLESTTYPGTTEEVILGALQATGLRVGEEFWLAFSPERIDPGNRRYGLHNTPKIIGGVTPLCTSVAELLYQQVIEQVIPVSSSRCAEMVKLLENTFRAVNIALVNEVALMCDRLGVDVWEVIEAAATKPFGFMPFYPGPGLGGHCIPIDPIYLAWKLKSLDYKARFIELASEVNAGMPLFVVEKLTAALNQQCKSIKGSRILFLGVSYKRDVGDVRESPALDIIRLVHQKGGEVSYHDPLVPQLPGGNGLKSVALTAALVRKMDCVVITTDHSSYDYAWLVKQAPLLLDTRGATRGVKGDKGHVITL